MTFGKAGFAAVLGMAMCAGCAANRSQLTTRIHRPLSDGIGLGQQVAVVSVVSAEKCRPSHGKQAAKFRKSLQQWLEKDKAIHVVASLELPPRYGADRPCDDAATLVQAARDRVGNRPIDTICLVQLKDGGGELAVSLGFPSELVSVRGHCDYDVRLISAGTGQELFCATGTWSERTDAPKLPLMPSASHFGEQVAQVMRPAARDVATRE